MSSKARRVLGKRGKRGVISIDDDDSRREQPAEKVIKKEELEEEEGGAISIENDDSTREQPAHIQKIVKKEEVEQPDPSIPSPKVAELPEKVVKTEELEEEEPDPSIPFREVVELPEKTLKTEDSSPLECDNIFPSSVDPEARGAARDKERSDHPLNIFKLFRPDEPKSISFDDAVGRVRAAHDRCGPAEWRVHWNTNFSVQKRIDCAICGRAKLGQGLFEHFMDEDHARKVRALGGAVSLPALKHWLRELQLAAKPQRQQAAAAELAARRDAIDHARSSIRIVAVCEEGGYVRLRNEGDREVKIAHWLLTHIADNGERQTHFKFYGRSAVLAAGATFAVRSDDKAGEKKKEEGSITMRKKRWPAGKGAVVILYDKSNVEVHRFVSSVDTVASEDTVAGRQVKKEEPEEYEERQEVKVEDDATREEIERSREENCLSARETSAHSINIFQLCRPDAPDSISFDSALSQVRAKFEECREEKWRAHSMVESSQNELFACAACEDYVEVSSTVDHFLSKEHETKVRANGAAVSLPALQHWLHELQLAAKAAEKPAPPGLEYGRRLW